MNVFKLFKRKSAAVCSQTDQYIRDLEASLVETRQRLEAHCADIEQKYYAEKHRREQLEAELSRRDAGERGRR